MPLSDKSELRSHELVYSLGTKVMPHPYNLADDCLKHDNVSQNGFELPTLKRPRNGIINLKYLVHLDRR